MSKYLAIDNSGSTAGSYAYWRKVAQLVNEHTGHQIIFWNTNASIMTPERAARMIDGSYGSGGTNPASFAPLVEAGSEIIIVTDGQIWDDSVRQCDEILQRRPFESVDIHFVSTGGQMNLSVAAPFTRQTRFTLDIDGEVRRGTTVHPIDLGPYYGEPERFLEDAETLLQSMTVQNLGLANMPLREELLKLQANLMKVLVQRASAEVDSNAYVLIRALLEAGRCSEAIEALKVLLQAADNSLPKRVEAFIQTMIQSIDGSSGYSFRLLEPGRLARAAPVEAQAVEELPEEAYEGQFECPVYYDVDLPVLLIADGAPVLEGVDKGYLDNLINNPLMILDNPDLLRKLRARIDHPIGLQAAHPLFAQGQASGQVVSPFTRRPTSTCMVLGTDEAHHRATKQALASLFFGNRLVGVPELWIGLVYLAVRDNPNNAWIRDNFAFMDSFKAYFIARCKAQTTRITLSGLPIDPVFSAPVDIALWYCLISAQLCTRDFEDGVGPAASNRLRSFGTSAVHLIELVQLFDYDYNRKWTLNQYRIYRAFNWMMRAEKRRNTPEGVAWSDWRNRVRAHWQNSLVVQRSQILPNGRVILLDGPARTRAALLMDDVMPQFGLVPEELQELMRRVDAGQPNSAVRLPTLGYSYPPVQAVEHYGYARHPSDRLGDPVPICPATMRPYTQDRESGQHWTDASVARSGPIEDQLSAYNYFTRFIFEKGRYPFSKEELALYMAGKEAHKDPATGNPRDTLPAPIGAILASVWSAYQAVLGEAFDFPASECKRRLYASMNKEERKRMEDA